jgi:hypothetical protein
MKKVMISALIAISFLMLMSPLVAFAAQEPLDQIHEYEITVSPQDDGTLFIDYYIKWEVLDDKREGPLTYIEVGVPNSDHRINSSSANVKDITSKTSGGAWVRLDLDHEYFAGEILEVRFSIWQNKLIERAEDGKLMYTFIPGWFDETPVLSETIRWKASEGIVSSTSTTRRDGYLVWSQRNLALGEKVVASVTYSEEYFQVTEESFKEESSVSGVTIFLIIIGIIVFIIIIFAVVSYLRDDGYGGGGGYGGSHTTFISTRSSCASSSCASSCACACACAGGGRVGCSRKSTTDYLRPKVRSAKK